MYKRKAPAWRFAVIDRCFLFFCCYCSLVLAVTWPRRLPKTGEFRGFRRLGPLSFRGKTAKTAAARGRNGFALGSLPPLREDRHGHCGATVADQEWNPDRRVGMRTGKKHAHRH